MELVWTVARDGADDDDEEELEEKNDAEPLTKPLDTETVKLLNGATPLPAGECRVSSPL
jgi:hypothetical protein